jgi:osmotically inducible protein OsmC
MAVRTADAEWKGDLKSGTGTVRSASGALNGKYSFSSRFEEGTGTNPEEMIGAALAGCYSMALANNLAQAGHTAESVRTTARVHLEKTDKGQTVTRIELATRAKVPGVDAKTFAEKAEATRTGCPISRALGAVQIDLDAKLV